LWQESIFSKKNFKAPKLWLWDSLEEIEWGDHKLPFFFLSLLIKGSFAAAIRKITHYRCLLSSPSNREKRKKDVAIKISVNWSIHIRQL
jgi:hypothetical protein